MTTFQRTFTGEADKRQMAALARRFLENTLHVVDLPYRLSSWALDVPENVGLWVDDHGRLVAWAVLQAPWWVIDCTCTPGLGPDLYPRILAWAEKRARDALDTPSGRSAWFVTVLPAQTDLVRALEDSGFACQADAPEPWSKVLMSRSAEVPVPDSMLLEGLTIRPLRGESEVGAYVELHRAAFGTDNMTVEWRARTLRCPEYVPDLDLVVVTQEGELIAFWIGWLVDLAGHISGQVEPMGVRPEWRKRGVGSAILFEGLRRLYGHGAGSVYVETDAYRDAALELYESAGFRVVQNVRVYRRDVAG